MGQMAKVGKNSNQVKGEVMGKIAIAYRTASDSVIWVVALDSGRVWSTSSEAIADGYEVLYR